MWLPSKDRNALISCIPERSGGTVKISPYLERNCRALATAVAPVVGRKRHRGDDLERAPLGVEGVTDENAMGRLLERSERGVGAGCPVAVGVVRGHRSRRRKDARDKNTKS